MMRSRPRRMGAVVAAATLCAITWSRCALLVLQKRRQMRAIQNFRVEDAPYYRTSRRLLRQNGDCAGKSEIWRILHRAGWTETGTLRNIACKRLPTWKLITEQLGNGPIILGLDQCTIFREQTKRISQPAQLRFAGLPAAISDNMQVALETALGINCDFGLVRKAIRGRLGLPSQCHYDLPTQTHVQVDGSSNELSVFIVQEPFHWIMALHDQKQKDIIWDSLPQWNATATVAASRLLQATSAENNMVTRSLQFRADNVHCRYNSTADLWSEWTAHYLLQSDGSTSPRLVVRYEDLLFHGDTVLQQIAECAGMQLPSTRTTGAAKSQWIKMLFQGMSQYKNDLRQYNFTAGDLVYARHALNPHVLKMLRYQPV